MRNCIIRWGREITEGKFPLCEPTANRVEYFDDKGCKYVITIKELKCNRKAKGKRKIC